MSFAWRPGSQCDVAAKRGADSVLASDIRTQFGRPSARRGCRICVTVRLPVQPHGETMYWQANANTPLSVTPLLNVPYQRSGEGVVGRNGCHKGCFWRVRFFSAPFMFSSVFRANLSGQRRNGLSKNPLLDNCFSARRLLPLPRSRVRASKGLRLENACFGAICHKVALPEIRAH